MLEDEISVSAASQCKPKQWSWGVRFYSSSFRDPILLRAFHRLSPRV